MSEIKNLALYMIITKHEKGPEKELIKELALFWDKNVLSN